tara:strand:+ start:667 stop:780 length:114 start_codon:yes stop_codon:yes gene_type:complete
MGVDDMGVKKFSKVSLSAAAAYASCCLSLAGWLYGIF